jgi:predicted MFS family arabinose efflux permease
MTRSRIKFGYFTLEALNSFAATFYVYYLFFLTRDAFGFTSRGNLFLTAIYGFVYLFASWQGGRFAQRCGYFKALRLGYAGMAAGLILGWLVPGVAGQILGLVAWTVPLCLIWPTIEALVVEGEDFQGTARMVGIYNLVWSSSSALAFCAGGWLWEKLGRNGLYGLPIGLMIIQFALVIRLEKRAKALPPLQPVRQETPRQPESAALMQSLSPRQFLRMAWLANPFAYVAINTVAAVIPQLAERFHLSAAQSGVFCSLWLYARFIAFLAFWKWTGWHYRFRWLLAAFIGVVAGFSTLLLAPQLWLVVVAQAVFGFSVGLIYYSSLFYSMDAGEAKGDHGGLHEAAIGLGIFAGPAVGAAALTCLPQYPSSGAFAVTLLLLCGLAGLLGMRRQAQAR